MKSRIHVQEAVVAVRWLAPDPQASAELTRTLERLHASSGRKLLLLIIVGDDCSIPDAATRKSLASEHERSVDWLEGVGVLVLGRSMRQSVIRAVFAGLNLVMSRRAREIRFCATVDEVLELAAQTVAAKADALREGLLADGVLQASEC